MKDARKTLGLVFLFSLLLVSMGCTGADTSDYEEELTKGEFLGVWEVDWGWLPICILAVIVSVSIQAIIYAIGYSFNLDNLKRYAQAELLQAAATALIAIVLISALIQSFDFISSLGSIDCGGEIIDSPIQADACRTQEILNKVGNLYDEVLDKDWGREIGYSTQITLFGIPVFNGAWMVDSIYNDVETYHSIAYICVNLMIALSAKLFLLQYINENMLAVFLPLGIILRTFHFTRGIGAFFISLAIGFFFIYPTVTFMMDSSFMESLDEPALPETIVSGFCNIPMFGSFSFGSAALASYGDRSSSAESIALSHSLSSFVATMQTGLLFNTLVAFAITVTFLRYGTMILGGDIAPFMGMAGRLI